MDPHQPDVFNPWIDKLAKTANVHIAQFQDLLDALRKRHEAFHDIGGRLSDHGLDQCYAADCTDAQAKAIFAKARAGNAATPSEREAFASYMMVYFGHLDAEKGWTKQLHLGARRNANTRALTVARPRHRLRLDRRPAADRRARQVSRSPRAGRTRCRRWSSTT